MCTHIWFYLPKDADTAAIGWLTEVHKVGRGLGANSPRPPAMAPDAASGVIAGERAHHVHPWKYCHCGWEAKGFAPVVSGALEAGAARWIGVLELWGGEKVEQRVRLTPEEFANATHTDEKVLYIVEPGRTPRAVVRRHGPRRRKSKK